MLVLKGWQPPSRPGMALQATGPSRGPIQSQYQGQVHVVKEHEMICPARKLSLVLVLVLVGAVLRSTWFHVGSQPISGPHESLCLLTYIRSLVVFCCVFFILSRTAVTAGGRANSTSMVVRGTVVRESGLGLRRRCSRETQAVSTRRGPLGENSFRPMYYMFACPRLASFNFGKKKTLMSIQNTSIWCFFRGV